MPLMQASKSEEKGVVSGLCSKSELKSGSHRPIDREHDAGLFLLLRFLASSISCSMAAFNGFRNF
jgi:hypothetical protein